MSHLTKILGAMAAAFSILMPLDIYAQAAKQSDTVNVGAIMYPKEGKEDELRTTLLSLTSPTRKEEGCIIYNIYEEENGALLLFEVWRAQEDLERHFEKPYLKDFLAKADGLLKGENDAHFGKLISTTQGPKADGRRDLATSKTVNIISIKKPKEGKSAELREALLSLVGPTREEDGCITYNVYEDKDGSLFLYEVWRSQEDLKSHFQKSYIKDFRNKAGDLTVRNDVYFGKLISEPSN